MAESAFVGDLGGRGRNCESQLSGLSGDPGYLATNRDDGLVASRGHLKDPAVDPATGYGSTIRNGLGEPAGMAAPFAHFSSQRSIANGMVTPASGTDNNSGQKGARPVFVGDFGDRSRNCELQPRGLSKEPGLVTDREASGLVASRGNLGNLTRNLSVRDHLPRESVGFSLGSVL